MDNEDWSEFTSKYPNYNDPTKDEKCAVSLGMTEKYLIYLLKIIGIDAYKSNYDTLLVIHSYMEIDILLVTCKAYILLGTEFIDLDRFNIPPVTMAEIAREWLQVNDMHNGFGYDDCVVFNILRCGNTQIEATTEEILIMNGQLLQK